MEDAFSHLDADGRARMVDVSGKEPTVRIARVRAEVHLNAATMGLLVQKAMPKGEVLGTARIAGVLAAKRTFELIPLCHPLPLDFADVRFDIDEAAGVVHVEAEARTSARTGVEMEALIAAQVAAATIYDMCKAIQKDIRITNCRLVYKSGGKSGLFEAK
jgi:cyclic pyranopterin phosphate synthase